MDPPLLNATRRDSVRFDDVKVGDELPELTIELTPTLIVATAIATRDFQDVHHDQDLARQRGSENIFMNILTSTGLVGRLVTDWAGPDAVLESVDIRLGAQNLPNDRMVLRGTVTKMSDDGTNLLWVAVKGTNSRGEHAVGVVRVKLPPETES